MKSEMEIRRKKEETEMTRQMEADRRAAEKLQAQMNSENVKLQVLGISNTDDVWTESHNFHTFSKTIFSSSL